jgi:hypothetical protein
MSGKSCVVVIVSLDERRATPKVVVGLSRLRLFKRKRERKFSIGELYLVKKLSHLDRWSERADRGAEVRGRRLKRRGARGRRRRHRRSGLHVARVIRRIRRVSRELGLVSESSPR